MTERIVSHYRILDKLGEGGMGVVYKAEDTSLRRTVALKFLSPHLAGDDQARRRFLKEAQAAAALSHPNICTIYEVNQEPPFLAMEFLEGQTVKEKIDARPLPIEEALEIAMQAAQGLRAAHARGVTHRDIKPANLMMTTEGVVKLMDFGLARLSDSSRLTEMGMVMGTPAYMSPEQARGETADARSDLWSLGVVLYEMVTGRRPFRGEGEAATVHSVLHAEAEPLTSLRTGVPVELDRVVAKCLAKDAEERYQHADDLLVDLRAVTKRVAGGVTVEIGRRRTWRWVGAASAAALAVTAVLAWYLVSKEGAAISLQHATFTKLTDQPGQEIFPSLSPDGKSFVYQGRVSGSWDIYLQRVGGKNPVNLTKDATEDDTQPAFSPDGERIVFRSEREGGGIFVMGATGESVKRLTDSGYNPAWSPDSKQVVFSTGWFWWATRRPSDRHRLFVVDAEGQSGSSGPRLVSGKSEDAMQPNWSPHGQRIAFWSRVAGNLDIWTVAASGGDPVRATREPSIDWNPVWSPDGKYLYFSSDRGGSVNLWRVRVDEDSGMVLGQAEPVTTPSSDAAYISFARDGRRMAYVNRLETGNIYKVDFDPVRETVSGQPTPVTQGSRLAVMPDVSPDGAWLAFSSFGKPEDLYVVRADGTGMRQITDDEHSDRFPMWSPDGKRISFYSNRGGGAHQIWTVNPDGSGLQQLTREPGGRSAVYQVWSPDGSRLAYTGRERDRPATLIVETGKPWDEKAVEALPGPGEDGSWFTAFSWSPDGRRLAGNRTVAGDSKGISVYSFESRGYEHFTEFGWFPRWLSDNRRLIFFTFATTSKSAMYLLDTRSRKVKEILSLGPNDFWGVAPTRDDRRIYIGMNSVEADVWLMSLE